MAELNARNVEVRIDGSSIGRAAEVTVSAEPEEVDIVGGGGYVARHVVGYDMTVEVELTPDAKDRLLAVMGVPPPSGSVPFPIGFPPSPKPLPDPPVAPPLREITGITLRYDDGKYFLAVEREENGSIRRTTEIIGVIYDPLVFHDFVSQMEENT